MNRRLFLSQSAGIAAAASAGVCVEQARATSTGRTSPDEILGQGEFRYRPERFWGALDPVRYPVKDCHGVVEDRSGRILVLTNDVHNNFIAYSRAGRFLSAWENRFPAAHGLEIFVEKGEERLWITDHDRQVVSMCTLDGRELRRLDPEVVAKPYSSLDGYHPTNVAVMPEGDFYVADGYGSNFIHHLDPDWKYIASFGGSGKNPENLNNPHAVWHDPRPGKPPLLVCDRGNALLKWFSREGKLERVVPVPGTQPSNVALMRDHHVAIASLNAMVLILDAEDRLVSAVGGLVPEYENGKLKPARVFNYALYHPHDVHVDAVGDIYIPQWQSNHTYPVKLIRLA